MTKLQINTIRIHQKEFRAYFKIKPTTYYKQFKDLKEGKGKLSNNPAVIDWVNKKMEE